MRPWESGSAKPLSGGLLVLVAAVAAVIVGVAGGGPDVAISLRWWVTLARSGH